MSKLSSLKSDNLEAFNLVEKIREAIYTLKTEENLESIKLLLKEDKEGNAYKYFFDSETSENNSDWDNPQGNNILLLAIAKGSGRENNKELTKELVRTILEDAQEKLNPKAFTSFINFRFCDGNPENCGSVSANFSSDGSKIIVDGYNNTPLTLAIQTGLSEISRQLVKLGADVTAPCGHGKFTPLHLALLHHVAFPGPVSEELIYELVRHKAKLSSKDMFGHTAIDLINFKGLNAAELSLFSINNKTLKEFFTPKPGKKYSFKELIENKEFKKFFQEKGFDNFEPTFTSVKLFKQFLNENREGGGKEGNKYILDVNFPSLSAPELTVEHFTNDITSTLGFCDQSSSIVLKLNKILNGELWTSSSIEEEKGTGSIKKVSDPFVVFSPYEFYHASEQAELLGTLTKAYEGEE